MNIDDLTIGGALDAFGLDFGLVGTGMPRSNRPQRKGTYYVVFDGSGTIGTHPAIVYAGAVSTQAQWGAFAESWEHLLERHDLAYFKMAEAMTFYGEFLPKNAEWGTLRDARRDALLQQFANLKTRYDLRVTGCGFATASSDNAFYTRENIIEKKKMVFRAAILGLLKHIPPEYSVLLICDIEKDVEDAFRGWIDGLIRTESEKVARIIGIGFHDDLFSANIQFADMVAWVLRQEIERQARRQEDQVNPLYSLLLDGSDVRVVTVGPDGLLSGLG